jgi:hypothetical protein
MIVNLYPPGSFQSLCVCFNDIADDWREFRSSHPPKSKIDCANHEARGNRRITLTMDHNGIPTVWIYHPDKEEWNEGQTLVVRTEETSEDTRGFRNKYTHSCTVVSWCNRSSTSGILSQDLECDFL